MEELIILILFLYPGALVELAGKYLFDEDPKSQSMSEPAQNARYFILSCLVSVISLMLFAAFGDKSVANFTDIVEALDGTVNRLVYVCISFAVSVLFAIIDRVFKLAGTGIKNRKTRKKEGAVLSRNNDAWKEIFDGKDYQHIRKDMIFRITSQGYSKAGFVKKYFDSFESGIVLTQTSAVEEQLAFEEGKDTENGEPICDPKDLRIGRPQYTFFEPKTGTFVEIFDGKRLGEYYDRIYEKAKEEKQAAPTKKG